MAGDSSSPTAVPGAQGVCHVQRSSHKDVFLFSHPRTASNLVLRLLSAQPDWIQCEYHFRGAFRLARTSLSLDGSAELSSDQVGQWNKLFQQGLARLCQERRDAAAQGRRLLVKNHAFHLWEPSSLFGIAQEPAPPSCAAFSATDEGNSIIPSTCTNPTRLPDEFLTSWQPVFIIRHPALVFESWYRAEARVSPVDILDPVWACFLTFQHSRELYDWFASKHIHSSGDDLLSGQVPEPIVIDADDVIEGGPAMSKLCDVCGMDPRLLCYEWEATVIPNDKLLTPRHLSFMSGLWSSTSIDRSKASRGLNMATKHEEWKVGFGPLVADALYRHAEKAMADYEYLRSRRV